MRFRSARKVVRDFFTSSDHMLQKFNVAYGNLTDDLQITYEELLDLIPHGWKCSKPLRAGGPQILHITLA